MKWRKNGQDKRHYDVCVCHGTCELSYILSICMWSTNLRFGIVICASLRLFSRPHCWMNWMSVIVNVGSITKWYLSLSHGRALVSIKICHVWGSGEVYLIAGKVEVENMRTVAGEIWDWREQHGWIVIVTNFNNCLCYHEMCVNVVTWQNSQS